jgi:hypothetical protein
MDVPEVELCHFSRSQLYSKVAMIAFNEIVGDTMGEDECG